MHRRVVGVEQAGGRTREVEVDEAGRAPVPYDGVARGHVQVGHQLGGRIRPGQVDRDQVAAPARSRCRGEAAVSGVTFRGVVQTAQQSRHAVKQAVVRRPFRQGDAGNVAVQVRQHVTAIAIASQVARRSLEARPLQVVEVVRDGGALRQVRRRTVPPILTTPSVRFPA